MTVAVNTPKQMRSHDQAQFESFKSVRDKLLHGEEVSLSSLPVVQTGKLLRRYLSLHLNASR
jgi:hypothetical protein